MILRVFAPMARQASTYSLLRVVSTTPRTVRAAVGMPEIVSASIIFRILDPSAATIAMASSMLGMAIRTSMMRMMIMSNQPP